MKNTILPVIVFLLICNSCVSKKKYLVAENGRLAAIERSENFRQKLTDCTNENTRQSHRIDSLLDDTTELSELTKSCYIPTNPNKPN